MNFLQCLEVDDLEEDFRNHEMFNVSMFKYSKVSRDQIQPLPISNSSEHSSKNVNSFLTGKRLRQARDEDIDPLPLIEEGTSLEPDMLFGWKP